MLYINGFKKEIILARRLKTWNYKLNKLNNFDWYILVNLLKRNVKNKDNAVLNTPQKKIGNLTNNSTNPFTHREVVKNVSLKHLTNEELDLLKFDSHHSLPQSRIYKTNFLV